MRYDGILRHFYHVGLDALDFDEAIKLIEEIGPVMRWMKGEDPDFVDPKSWFENANKAR